MPEQIWLNQPRMACGCVEGFHTGPGCPVYRASDIAEFRCKAILRVTLMHEGVLYMQVPQGWKSIRTPAEFRILNESLDVITERYLEYAAGRSKTVAQAAE